MIISFSRWVLIACLISFAFTFCLVRYVFPHYSPPTVMLRFINEQVLQHDQQFQGIPVGGLSALSYDPQRDTFLALSDDKAICISHAGLLHPIRYEGPCWTD